MTHITNGPVLQSEKTNEIVSDCATPTSHGTKIVLLHCAKNNVQTNTLRAQRAANVSSLYLALLTVIAVSALCYDFRDRTKSPKVTEPIGRAARNADPQKGGIN